MSYHPYQAPNSDLTQVQAPVPVRPRVINLACALFIVSMLMSLIDLIPGLAPERVAAFNWTPFFKIVLIVILYGMVIGVVYAIAKGKNWARWVMLGLTALGLALDFLPDESPPKAQILLVISVITTVMDWSACALLFFGPGRHWFVSLKNST